MIQTPPHPDEEALAAALADYHRRQASGESVWVGQYRERLGLLYPELERLVEVEESLDLAMEQERASPLPRVFGPYTLVARLGEGGMGVVYKATERALQRTVAVKVLHRGIAHADAEARRRFKREALECARVRHDNIVVIHQAGEIDGELYYAMDLVPGESLEAKVKRGERSDPRALAAALLPLAEGLHKIHAVRIVHRDIKPGNIMVTPEGKLVLTDFGLAKNLDDQRLTRTGQAVGSLPYISPEQLRGQQDRISAATDVYGLGAVLYEALTGRTPYPGETREAVARLILDAAGPQPPRAIDASIPQGLADIAMVALQKRPEDRYASAAAFADDLQRFLDGEATRVPPGLLTRARRWVREHAKPLAAAAVVLVVLGTGARAWWDSRPAEVVLAAPYDEGRLVSVNVLMNGRVLGMSGADPMRLELEPGEYTFEAQAPGFASVPLVEHLAPGSTNRLRLFLGRVTDPALVAQLREQVRATSLDGSAATRAPTQAPELYVLAPRGEVRAQDLAAGWCIDLDTGWPGGGTLVLRRGVEELWRAPFAPTLAPRGHLAFGAFPPQVLAQLKPGDEFTLAWHADGPSGARAPLEARGRLVDLPEAERAQARIAALFAPQDEVAERMRIESLVGHGLVSAALLRALEHVRAFPRPPESWRVLASVVARLDERALLLDDIAYYLADVDRPADERHPAPEVRVPGR